MRGLLQKPRIWQISSYGIGITLTVGGCLSNLPPFAAPCNDNNALLVCGAAYFCRAEEPRVCVPNETQIPEVDAGEVIDAGEIVEPPAQPLVLDASNRKVGSTFGISVAINRTGDLLAVGAEGSGVVNQDIRTDETAGVVYIFRRTGTVWQEAQVLTASNTRIGDRFGGSVSWGLLLDGTTEYLAVGAYLADAPAGAVNVVEAPIEQAGAVYIFTPTPDKTLREEAILAASNAESNDAFGISMAAAGNTIVVGANREASNARGIGENQLDNSSPEAGAAYVFVRDGNGWHQQAYLKANNTGRFDLFGTSVAINESGDTIAVGAFGEDGDINSSLLSPNNAAFDAGAVYIFTRTGPAWTQQAYLKSNNAGAGDYFGFSVSLSDDTLLVGAPQEDSNAHTINGNDADDTSPESGAAYVFTRAGFIWTQQAYLKPNNTNTNFQFGTSVSITRNTALIGAPFESGDAAGFDQIQSQQTISKSGAAYLYQRANDAWTFAHYLKADQSSINGTVGTAVAIRENTQAFPQQTVLLGAPRFNNNTGAGYVYVNLP